MNYVLFSLHVKTSGVFGIHSENFVEIFRKEWTGYGNVHSSISLIFIKYTVVNWYLNLDSFSTMSFLFSVSLVHWPRPCTKHKRY